MYKIFFCKLLSDSPEFKEEEEPRDNFGVFENKILKL
jgi:hypothetical protein